MQRGNPIAGAIAVVVCCALGFTEASGAAGGCARAAAAADRTTPKQRSDSVLCLVNGERARRGLPAVRASRPLTRSARRHSRDMVARRYFSHVSPAGETAHRRILRTGYLRKRANTKVGETIAWGTAANSTPANLVRAFMKSAGHRRVLLDRRFRDVGIGFVLGAPIRGRYGGATLTLDFGRR